MSSSSQKPRATFHPVEELRDLLVRLFELSAKQLETLGGDQYEDLNQILSEKAQCMERLPAAIKEVRSRGWDWNNPATFPEDRAEVALLQQIGELSRRLQTHEKYVIGQMMLQRNQLSDRLDAISLKRCAAAGYRGLTVRGSSFDKAT